MVRIVTNTSMFLAEAIYAGILLLYIFGVLLLTKRLYRFMTNKANLRENVAIYYNRKIIHMLAGGVTALLVPSLFSSPIIPTLMAYLIAFLLISQRLKGKHMTWFQTIDNFYEVNFCFAWGTSVFILWTLTGNPYMAILPALFISFGDAITGVLRNAIYARRTKSWIGNIGMIALTLPVGYIVAGLPGLIAGLASSIIEHFEIPPVLDDNVLITIASTGILAASHIIRWV